MCGTGSHARRCSIASQRGPLSCPRDAASGAGEGRGQRSGVRFLSLSPQSGKMRKPEKLEYFQPPSRFPRRRRRDTRSPGSRGSSTELVAASRVTSGSLAKAEMTGHVFSIRLTWGGSPVSVSPQPLSQDPTFLRAAYLLPSSRGTLWNLGTWSSVHSPGEGAEGWPLLDSAGSPHSLLGNPFPPLILVPHNAGQWRVCPGVSWVPLTPIPLPSWDRDKDRAQCSGHLNSLAVVHLHHVEPEAVDTPDRGYEGAGGPIKASALIHQDLGKADAAEVGRGDNWGSGKLGWGMGH